MLHIKIQRNKNVRIKRCKLAQGKEYLGYNSSKDEYYYGFKVHLITTRDDGIVEFEYSPASYHDQIAFSVLDFELSEVSVHKHRNRSVGVLTFSRKKEPLFLE